MNVVDRVLTMAILLSVAGSAKAELVVGNFLSSGDDLLITDTATGLQWLAPRYTAGQTFDDSFVQNLINTYGFTYATESQVENMINTNFNSPPVGSPGTPAGFTDAGDFFDVFGINENVGCSGGPCPRTQGLTSTSSGSGTQDGVGLIQIGSDGWLIEQNAWSDSVSDLQMGSWLVLEPSSVPEPSAFVMSIVGLACIAYARRLSP